MKSFLAELLGTYLLSIVVISGVSSSTTPLPVPVLASLTLMLMVYIFGSISGAHINPAITLGLYWNRKIDLFTMLKYWIAQVSGAMIARWMAIRFFKLDWSIEVTNTIPVMWGEIIGTAILAFAVSTVVWGIIKDYASGAIIGTGLLLGILVASNSSNAILNPAVAIALNSMSMYYVVGPLLGGILGMYIGRYFKNN